MRTSVPVKHYYYNDKVVEFEDGLRVRLDGSDLASKNHQFSKRLKDVEINPGLISMDKINEEILPRAHFGFLDYYANTTYLNVEAGDHQGENRTLTPIEIKTIIFG